MEDDTPQWLIDYCLNLRREHMDFSTVSVASQQCLEVNVLNERKGPTADGR